MSTNKDRIITNGVTDISVSILDNGYTVEFGGYNKSEEWVTSNRVINSTDELCTLIREVALIPHD